MSFISNRREFIPTSFVRFLKQQKYSLMAYSKHVQSLDLAAIPDMKWYLELQLF
jgi:hypothetical protein